MKSLLLALGLLSCTQDYSVINSKQPETIVITETVTETETVEIEIEVPVYVEVEVPVNEGVIWIDSFTQHMSIDGIDILWVVDRSGSMRSMMLNYCWCRSNVSCPSSMLIGDWS